MLKNSLRLLAAVGLLLALEHRYGPSLTEALLPFIYAELRWLDDSYRILNLGLAMQGADSVLRLDVTLARFVVVGAHVIAPDPRGHAVVTTLAASLLTPVMVGLALLAAWPAQRALQYAWRLPIGVPLLLLLLPLDVPLVLLGEVWELVRMARAPDSFSPLIAWKDFLQGGGRLALAFCAAMASIAVSQKLSPPRVG